MKTLTFMAGSHVSDAISELIAEAPAEGEFNGITITAHPGDKHQTLLAQWNAAMDARAKAYRESPEGLADAAEQEQKRQQLQSRHDSLMNRLPSLDFKDQVAVLDWLCAMQEPSDYRGVIVRGNTILCTFSKHGFKPSVNTGADFKPDDRDNVFRYLVGQALDGLSGPAIHPILHKFVGEWKAKFLPVAA